MARATGLTNATGPYESTTVDASLDRQAQCGTFGASTATSRRQISDCLHQSLERWPPGHREQAGRYPYEAQPEPDAELAAGRKC